MISAYNNTDLVIKKYKLDGHMFYSEQYFHFDQVGVTTNMSASYKDHTMQKCNN